MLSCTLLQGKIKFIALVYGIYHAAHTHASLYVTRVLAHARLRGSGVRILRGGYESRGQAPWLLYAAPAGALELAGRMSPVYI